MVSVRKFLLGYLVAVGLGVHLLLLGAWLARPDLVWRVQQVALAKLRPHLPHALAFLGTTAGRTDPPARIAAILPPWRPDLTNALPPGTIQISGHPYPNLQAAARALRDGDVLQIGPGVYHQALVIRRHDVTLQGLGHVVFEGATAEGKAALVLKGNNTQVRNIECRGITVSDRNGACIRLEGAGLLVEHVYFHHGEEGILTGRQPGRVTVRDSRFELLGKAGRAHGIYTGGGQLEILDSQFLSAVDEGHEIKSRSLSTRIERSIIASLDGNDSRLLDLPHGGLLVIRDSILEEGPASVNSDLVGVGLEGRLHPQQRIELRGNIILLDNPAPNRLLHRADGIPAPEFEQNLVIGMAKAQLPGLNAWLEDRAAADLPAYPALPPLPGN